MDELAIFFLIIAFLQFGDASANDACEKRFHIISSMTQKDCPADIKDTSKTPPEITKYYLFLEGGDHECFPFCQPVKPGLTTAYPCSKDSPCPPAYECKETDPPAKHCILQENSCFKYHVNYDNSKDKKYFDAMWKPECLPDGTWAPKQCKGEKYTGRCFCFDAIGNRLDGHQWRTKSENMTCACSRKRDKMAKDKSNPFVSLHCDDEGNYEPLQCNDGQCWCADPKTGEVLSKIVVEKMWNVLPCYDAERNGAQYLRQCESQLYAQKKIIAKLINHGTVDFKFDYIRCDADGTFGVYRIGDGRATCTWKDDKAISSFVTDLSDGSDVLITCNCARDLRIYELAKLNPEDRGRCNGNGNYMEMQVKVNDDGVKEFYCVDSDGYRKSPMLPNNKIKCSGYQ